MVLLVRPPGHAAVAPPAPDFSSPGDLLTSHPPAGRRGRRVDADLRLDTGAPASSHSTIHRMDSGAESPSDARWDLIAGASSAASAAEGMGATRGGALP